MTINYRDAKFEDIKNCVLLETEYTVTSVFCGETSAEDDFKLPFFIVDDKYLFGLSIADKARHQHYRTAWLQVEEIFIDPVAPILRLSGMDGYDEENYFIGLDLSNDNTELKFGLLDYDFIDEDEMAEYYQKIDDIHDKIVSGKFGVEIPKDFGIVEAVEGLACNRDQLVNMVRRGMTGWM